MSNAKAFNYCQLSSALSNSVQSELFFRALSNIVRNAIRYAGNDGEILISADKTANNSVEIKISDTGEAVPEDALDKIFDPLYCIKNDRSRQTGGTGLGLAIVKICVEACQGKVFAVNNQPNGLVIIISLKN
jgi:two-component system, OmpR family, sensor histidine kinase CpxA